MSVEASTSRRQITLFRAVTLASSLYLKNIGPLLSVYLLLMSVPILLQTYLLATYLSVDGALTAKSSNNLRAAIATIPPSDPHYVAWAFARMFGDLLTPFALASLILAIKNLIQSGKPEPLRCLSMLGRKWLTIAQFGLMMHIIWYAGNEGIRMLGDRSFSDATSNVLVFVVIVAFTVTNFAYVSALVVVTLDRVDPIRGIGFGLWFAIRHTFGSVGRFVLLTTLAVTGLCIYAFAIEFTKVELTFVSICAFTVFSSWVYFAMVLYVLDRVATRRYGDVPRFLRVRA